MPLLPQRYSYKSSSLRIFARLIDIFLLPVQLCIQKRSNNIVKNISNNRFLIINCGGIGDLVLMEPLIRNLHLQFPKSSVDVLVRGDIAATCYLIPGIDGIIKFDFQTSHPVKSWLKFFYKLKKELKIRNKYSSGFDVKGDPFAILLMLIIKIPNRFGFNTGGLGGLLTKHTSLSEEENKSLSNIQLISSKYFKETDYSPRLVSNIIEFQEAEEIIDTIWPQNIISKVIVISLGAGEDSKLWVDQYWQNLLERLSEQFNIVIIGTTSQFENIYSLPKQIIKMIDLPLLHSIAFIKKASLFIGLDTGLSHIARAFLVPTICLFSLSHNPKMWGPAGASILPFTPPESLDLNPEIVYDEVIRLLA